MVRERKKERERRGEDDVAMAVEARKHVWMGAIPLHLDLHPSEVTTLPGPSPFLIMAPRNGYLPLLVDAIRPHFKAVLPPGSDTIWFDYRGLPLKWHIPTGVLFDLLCVEPERPWNLTVHFRAFPSDVLTLCEDEAVKWNFINTLKEASYVMYGSTKSVMNMSQSDQSELWRCVVKGDLEGYDRISARLRPAFGFGGGSLGGTGGWGYAQKRSTGEGDSSALSSRAGSEGGKPGRIPMRVYVRTVEQDFDEFFDLPHVASWDEVGYMTRPVDVPKEEGTMLTLRDALLKAVPHLFSPPLAAIGDAAYKAPTIDSKSCETYPSQLGRSPPDLKAEGTEASSDESTIGPKETFETSNPSSPSFDNRTQVQVDMPELQISPNPQQESQEEDSRAQPHDIEVEETPGCLTYPDLGKAVSDVATSEMAGVLGTTGAAGLDDFKGIIRIQGIEASLDLPLQWVARNLSGPEHFIHLIVICTWVAPVLHSGAGD